jgi:hypothetical protein
MPPDMVECLIRDSARGEYISGAKYVGALLGFADVFDKI